MATKIKVNGVDRTVDVDDDTAAAVGLARPLGMTGTKFGCGMALCGACTVHINGDAVRSCITPIGSVGNGGDDDRRLSARSGGSRSAGLDRRGGSSVRLLPVGPDHDRVALLTNNPNPTDADIDEAMRGNICRCGTYSGIREAIKQAAQSN